MFRRFHHIDQILEYGVPRETVVEVFPGNLANGGDFDLSFLQPILAADFYTGSFPDSHTGRYFAALDAGAEFLCEEHEGAAVR